MQSFVVRGIHDLQIDESSVKRTGVLKLLSIAVVFDSMVCVIVENYLLIILILFARFFIFYFFCIKVIIPIQIFLVREDCEIALDWRLRYEFALAIPFINRVILFYNGEISFAAVSNPRPASADFCYYNFFFSGLLYAFELQHSIITT